MEHAYRRLPGPAARRLLRQLRPLHAALLGAVPEAARPEVPGRPGPMVRLHRAVVEIREAVLALRPYVDPELAAAARKVVHPAGLAGDEAAAAVEASVLAAGGVPGWQHMPGPDLPSEAAWLVRVARAFDRDSVIVRYPVERSRPAVAAGRCQPDLHDGLGTPQPQGAIGHASWGYRGQYAEGGRRFGSVISKRLAGRGRAPRCAPGAGCRSTPAPP